MKNMLVKICLRLAISTAFLSAVADRFGLWPSEVSVWGNWNNFINYTQIINPWFPESVINSVGVIATAAELLFAMCLIIGFKTEWVAKLSGLLLLVFGLSMTFSTGIKGALDFSVFTASAAAFALSLIKEKHWKLDNLLEK
ncbi:DoxX family protein [Aestuariibaculum suncheonense]|uniref:DoxX family protein n=2 Tax=Aestuariibaculum suncheonense TaxID=1028745 RepID=A0A8J6UB24_9FLAO|nr:DoxX family protein [Aestuariibaculum suncheonense]